MAFINGTIVLGSEILIEEIPIWIDVFSEGYLKSWKGSFTLPENHKFDFVSIDKCEVHLADGRKGTIIPNHFDGKNVSFKGTGPLE